MSFFASFPYADRIELLTDAANYLATGEMIFTSPKVYTSPDCPMAVTGRGKSTTVLGLADSFIKAAQCGSFFEAMIDIERVFDNWRADGEVYAGRGFQMWIGGWCEEWGLRQFQISSVADMGFVGIEPMRVNTIHGPLYAGPTISQEEVAGIIAPEQAARGTSYFGPALCQAIRQKTDFTVDDPEKRQIHGVGGWIDQTIITPKGTSTRKLMSWPDQPFRKIDPELEPNIHIAPAMTFNPPTPAPAWMTELDLVAA